MIISINKKLFFAISFLFAIFFASKTYSQVEYISTGTSTAYAVSVPGVFPLRSGMQVTFKAHTSCGVGPTVNVSGTGPMQLLKNGGSALVTNDILSGQIVTIAYDGAKWQMLTPSANTSTSNGTVTSVGITAPASLFTVSGSPITSSGTLTLGFQTLGSNVFFASPNGLGGQPSFRSIVSGDLPLIPLSKGGTNASLTAVNGGIVYSDASAFGITSAGTSGQVLQSNGAAAPSWVTPSFLPSGTSGQTLRHNGSGWVANSFLFNDGSNIGIGTISPTYPLHIESSSDAILNINSKSASQNTIAGLRLSMFDSYVGTQYFLYSEKNDNTTNSGSSDFIMRKDFSTAGGYLKFFKFDNSTNNLIVNDSKTYTGNFGNFVVANGNVGIGVALPSKKLHVENPISNGDSLGNISVFHNSSGIGTAFSAVSNNSGTNAPGTTWSSLRIAGYNVISPIGPIDFAIMAKGYYSSVYAGIFLNQSAPNNYVALGGGSTFTLKIVDGNQGANKVLKSDASGVASWADLSSLPGGLSGGTINYVPKWTSATGLSSTSLIFDNGTSVGIGTSSPTGKLHLLNTGGNITNVIESNSNVGTWISIGNTDALANWFSLIATGSANGEGAGKLIFTKNLNQATSQGTIMTFDRANLNVGIGTTFPNTKLHIAGGDISTDWDFQMTHSQSTWGANANRPFLNKQWSGSLGDYMYLGSTGNNSNNTQGAMIISANAGIIFGKGSDNADALSVEHVRISNNGYVGIGTNPINYPLEVVQTSGSAFILSKSSSAYAGLIIDKGNISQNGYILYRTGGIYDWGVGTKGSSDFSIFNWNTNLENFRINLSDGNVSIPNSVGIGVAPSSANQLYVQKGNTGTLAFFDNNSSAGGTGLNTQVTSTASSSGTRYGLYSLAWYGQGLNYGTYSYAYGGTNTYGIYAIGSGGTSSNYAGYFSGNVSVTGTLSKGGGSFKIDHPLDPENKILYHSFVESPDMMNVYNGNVTTDASGNAVVSLPDYFEALNKDFRYQLTIIGGGFSQAIIAEKVSNNQFTIKTDKPNIEVSWQVTGIRKDPWAEKNRIPNSVEKLPEEKGLYIHPEEYGMPEVKGIDYKNKIRGKKENKNQIEKTDLNLNLDPTGKPKR